MPAVLPVPWRARLRRAVASLLVLMLLAAVVLGGGFGWFVLRAGRTMAPPARADGMVVLTGGAGRVELAMRLLAEGRAERLLISGVGRVDFPELAARAGVDVALAVRVTLGHGARTTAGNARETAEWVRAHDIRSLVVVTSGYHMDRALTELRRTLPPDVEITPVALVPQSADGHDRVPLRLLASEYAKWLGAMLGVTWMPGWSQSAILPAPTRVTQGAA